MKKISEPYTEEIFYRHETRAFFKNLLLIFICFLLFIGFWELMNILGSPDTFDSCDNGEYFKPTSMVTGKGFCINFENYSNSPLNFKCSCGNISIPAGN